MDPRIEAFNTKFHTEKYGPANRGESFEQQRQQEVGVLTMAYWINDTSFVQQEAKRATLATMLTYAAFAHYSMALTEQLILIMNDLLHA